MLFLNQLRCDLQPWEEPQYALCCAEVLWQMCKAAKDLIYK